MKHWWIKDKPFKRVRLSTLYRLGLLFTAEVMEGKIKNNVAAFLMWLGQYMEDVEDA